jgi:WD40 repeat protein
MQVIAAQGNPKIVSFSAEPTIASVDVRTQQILGKVRIEGGLSSAKMQMAVSQDRAFVGGVSGEIYEYDLSTFRLTRKTRGHDSPVPCVAVKPSAGLMVTGDKKGLVKIWVK